MKNVTKGLLNDSLIKLPWGKVRLKKFHGWFSREIIIAVHMGSFEFLGQIEQIEMVGIGPVIDGRLLLTQQCILHELDSMTSKKTCSNGLE